MAAPMLPCPWLFPAGVASGCLCCPMDLGSSLLWGSERQTETHLVLLPVGQAPCMLGLLFPCGASSRLFWFLYHEGGGLVGKRGRGLGGERQSKFTIQ